MKRFNVVIVLFFLLTSALLAITEAPVEDVDLAQRPSQETSREYQYYYYADASELTNLNWPTPERATLFQMTTDFGLQYPVTITQLTTYFYEHSSYPWDSDEFYWVIYDVDGSTVLYQSETVHASAYPTQTVKNLALTPVTVNDDFYLAVVPVSETGFPSSCSTNRGTGYPIHSYVGEAGSWVLYDNGSAAYEWLTSVYAEAPEAATGNIEGHVYEYNSTTPIEGAYVVLGGSTYVITSTDGFFQFNDVYVGTYDLDCYGPDGGYFFDEASSVEVVDGGTTTHNFFLQWAEISSNPASVSVDLNPEATTASVVQLSNDGPGTLEYNAYLNFFAPALAFDPDATETTMNRNSDPNTDTVPTIVSNPTLSREVGDVVFELDAGTPTSETQLLGIEYADGFFYATGAGSDADPNYIYKLDTDGNLIQSWEQDSSITGWGLRDLAYDGTYLYAGNETSFVRINPATGEQTILFTFTSANFGGVTCIRALAYVPGEGFYTKSFSSAIVKFDTAGNVLEVIASPGADAAYGMSYDPVSGTLWAFDQSGIYSTTFIEIDPTAGTLTGNTYNVPLVGGCSTQMAGGSAYSADLVYGKRVLIGMTQGTPSDFIFAMELEATETWVSITSNASGTISGYARDSINLGLEFDAAGLSGGAMKEGELVIVHNGSYNGNYRIPLTLNVLGQLDAPLDITIEEVSGDMHITWQAVTGATTYKIYRSNQPDDGFTIYDTSSTNSFIDSAPGATKYFYRVTAE